MHKLSVKTTVIIIVLWAKPFFCFISIKYSNNSVQDTFYDCTFINE